MRGIEVQPQFIIVGYRGFPSHVLKLTRKDKELVFLSGPVKDYKSLYLHGSDRSSGPCKELGLLSSRCKDIELGLLSDRFEKLSILSGVFYQTKLMSSIRSVQR